MVPGRCRWLLLAALAAEACGARSPDGGVRAAAPVSGADAGVEAALDTGPADAGGDGGPAALVSDASLVEIGVAPCEAVVARFLTCPAVPAGSKAQMAEASRRWRQEAATSVEARERLAATCLEIARMTEDMLLQIGC
jgi:hypothetical protein